jgi:hypothetical protein
VIWRGIFGIICIRISVSTEKSVPKIVDDGKIAVAMYVMHKMELLLSSEPRKSRLSAPSSEDGAGGGADRAHDRGSPDGGPRVRIHLPPAESCVATAPDAERRSDAADGCGTSFRTPRILARATRIQVAEVPRANLLRVCKRLQPGCKPTDAEDSTDDGNRDYAFV